MTAKDYFKNPDLYGWDIDKKLINIAKQNIEKTKLKNLDALLNQDYEKYDLVIGNPPYFEFSPPKEIKEKFKEVVNGRVNIFSLFIYQGIKWLKEEGYVSKTAYTRAHKYLSYLYKQGKFLRTGSIQDRTYIKVCEYKPNPKQERKLWRDLLR